MSKWQNVPKIELHKHLEGAIRFSTVYELAEELQGLSIDEARQKAMIFSPSTGLEKVFETFWVTQKILKTTDIIERITFEVCEDASKDGIVILELRYQPSYIQINHLDLTFAQIHQAILAGIKRAQETYPICVGLIGIIGRNLTKEVAEQTTEFIIENADTFVGCDLANVELGYDCTLFTEYFRRLKAAGLHVTVHQGEEGDPVKVIDAVEQLGAERIGHGIQIIKNPSVLQYIKEKDIVLEVCVTSNYIVGVVETTAASPITKLKEAGVKVTVSTDDPVIFGDYSLTSEYDLLEREHGWTAEDFKEANKNAFHSSFVPEEIRKKYWSEELFDAAVAKYVK